MITEHFDIDEYYTIFEYLDNIGIYHMYEFSLDHKIKHHYKWATFASVRDTGESI